MFNIGVLYSNGHGVYQDYARAMEWWMQAADRGEATAMRNIGVLYSNGYGVIQDYARAMEWWMKAADKGDAVAIRKLSFLYSKSDAIFQDYKHEGSGQGFSRDRTRAGSDAPRNIGLNYRRGAKAN
jgi:hypothetical protein